MPSPALTQRRRPAFPGSRTLYIVLPLLLLIVALVFARVIVVSALIGLGLGAILAPLLRYMQRRLHIPRPAAALVFVLACLLVLGGIGWGLFAVVDAQVTALAERMPQLISQLQSTVDRFSARYTWIGNGASSINIAETAKAVGTTLFKGAWSGIAVVSSLVFAGVIGLYAAVDAESYHRGMIRAFPPRWREKAGALMQASGATIRTWFHAQLIDMLIIGTLTALGLWLVGMDFWLLFGILTGLLGIIPYVGIALVVIFASLVTLASVPDRLPWIVGVFLITQQLEGHLILPMVMRGRAQLPAVPLLVFMLLMGSWAGLLGVLMAPPLFAVCCVLWRDLYLPWIESRPQAP